MVEKLQNQYIEKDKAQQIFIMPWLKVYKNIDQNRGADLSKYITNFHNMSKKLVEEGVLSIFIQGIWFLQGLPEKIQEVVVRQTQANVSCLGTVKYLKLKKPAEEVKETAWTVSYLQQKEY